MIPADTLAMRQWCGSAIYSAFAPSNARPLGSKPPLVAGPPSPPNAHEPSPATVVIMPLDTSRTRQFAEMKRLPAPSKPNPNGCSPALVAGPPSPLNWQKPFPAIVSIMPPATLTTRQPPVAVGVYSAPDESSATACGYGSV